MITSNIPKMSYGILFQDAALSELDDVVDQVRRLGFAILNSDFNADEMMKISDSFNQTRAEYIKTWGEDRLRHANEIHTIRAPLLGGDPIFTRLATNSKLIAVLSNLIVGKFILNQQNGIVNPPREHYNQGFWHRDLPYQHYISDSPLAVNALFCVDDFSCENGSTFVLPASHKTSSFPSEAYIQRNALQVEARAGQYILLDCMCFHSGGFNQTNFDRRAVNHVYTIPYFKQQIKLAGNLSANLLTPFELDLLGITCQEPLSVEQYLFSR